jgi:hypothetical protein
VDVVASVGADQESAAVVEPGEGALDDPAFTAEAGAVLGLTTRDHRLDPALPEQPPVLVVVVAAVGDQPRRPAPRAADTAADGRHAVEQVEQLGDVVAVAAGERPGEWDAAAVYKEVVLAAGSAAIDGARTRFRAPFFACRWLESATARSHSS